MNTFIPQDLFKQRNSEYIESIRKIIDCKRASLMDREQILRNQLETVSS